MTAATGKEPPKPPELTAREAFYQERIHQAIAKAQALGARSRLVSNLRGLSFAVFAVLGLWAIFGSPPAGMGVVATVFALCFLGLVVWHSRVIGEEDQALRWVQVNRDAQARSGERFRYLPQNGSSFRNLIHPYAGDLDIFGPGSLFQKMCAARTQFGQARLASFLMNRADPGEIAERQAAAQELAPLLDVRQELEALALAVVEPLRPTGGVSSDGTEMPRPQSSSKDKAPDPELLLGWAESDVALSKNKPLVVVAFAAPAISIGLLISAMVLGWHPIVWLSPLIAQAIILLTAREHTVRVYAAVSASEGVFLRFGPMLRLLEELPAKSEKIKHLQAQTRSKSGARPSQVMRQFERIVGWWEVRHNGLIYPFINGIFLWDIHCALRLEAWQRNAGKHLRQWFKALGELEALSSLAGFSADNPDFCWPNVSDAEPHFKALGLAHPLIGSKVRVANDVTLPGPGRALLVTGSNMSGKSTLLRAMGVNTVLSLMGAPVCAKQMSLTPLAVRTSMRISDSLDEGVSHFYAEVRKLKSVLDSLDGGTTVLFLLDEILHGTYSRERQIGARWVLAELLKRGAMGAVSTHDEGLCELPEALMDHVEQVHLRETVVDDEMTFDYLLRAGPVRSGNALRLMRTSGIQVPLE